MARASAREHKVTRVTGRKAAALRRRYVDAFVDTESEFYESHMKHLRRFRDGLGYTGYLWDCLRRRKLITPEGFRKTGARFADVYVMWDIHSSENIRVPNYWKFGKRTILHGSFDDLAGMADMLPTDLYFFDDSFRWSLITTHEPWLDDIPNNCYLATGRGRSRRVAKKRR